MAREAAIFDLDRTLLAGSSGPVFGDALRAAGLLGPPIPGEGLLNKIFQTVGETVPTMMLTRQAATLSKGKLRVGVQAAANDAADALLGLVQPGAYALLDEHRAAGRLLVLATTTPRDLVAPLAERLGIPHVVATRYGLAADGTYDGTINGPFVWSSGKLAAVRDWASAHDVDLTSSWFYSDSIYDLPLLTAVGHPFAVNPDPRLRVVAIAKRWPILNLGSTQASGPTVAKLPGTDIDLQRLAMTFARPELVPFARFDIEGVENIPASGPVIVCGNHRSYFDVFAVSLVLARSGRTVRFLGKREIFEAPVIGQIASALGGIRVDRGTGSDEPLKAAEAALRDGAMVALMPQGTIPRGPAFFDPVLKGRWGAAKLAAHTGATVVPLGLWGTELVWPRSSRLPNLLNLTDPPTIRVRVGPPVPLARRSFDADTKKIMKSISALLPPVARQRRTPTEHELARTYPPGWKGDPQAELERRPGKD